MAIVFPKDRIALDIEPLPLFKSESSVEQRKTIAKIDEQTSDIISQIDYNRISMGRGGGKSNDYKLDQLKDFLRKLGVTKISSMKKAEIVEVLRRTLKERGLAPTN
jgi:hypothetical protein